MPEQQFRPASPAERQRRHRAGLAHQLREIREDLAELRADVAQLVEQRAPEQHPEGPRR